MKNSKNSALHEDINGTSKDNYHGNNHNERNSYSSNGGILLGTPHGNNPVLDVLTRICSELSADSCFGDGAICDHFKTH